MGLDKPTLIQTLITIFNNPTTSSNVETVAQQLADAIEVYVKSGTVVGLCPSNGGALLNGKVE
ncbi:hypothetical protein FUA48_16060 [Flavobacterium alkalisoli]|uniref:Uncharacterized protein n=1 Tax=Flavobacterium alkalisoli TaxID=2602769 RepID=A0A5B9FVT6_9FLAO|nr:hypothetical protein [Flavobacterium alkalisoli]QEE51035.1 hypothetical protein FUA48_16060 [Flavobacterium alkalisoli]